MIPVKVSILLVLFLPCVLLNNNLHCFITLNQIYGACSTQFQKSTENLTDRRGQPTELYNGSPSQKKYCKAMRNFDSCISRGKKRLYGCSNVTINQLDTLVTGETSPLHEVRTWLKCSSSRGTVCNVSVIALASLLALIHFQHNM